jgi:hypothetical protein
MSIGFLIDPESAKELPDKVNRKGRRPATRLYLITTIGWSYLCQASSLRDVRQGCFAHASGRGLSATYLIRQGRHRYTFTPHVP